MLIVTELRNRIYHFATEDCNTREYAVLVQKNASAKPTKPYPERTWKFFALTQTCKQIRAEYRPLWIRAAALRFPYTGSASMFIETFMPSPADLKHAPKLMQIAWDNDIELHGRMQDLTQLLRLHSFCPEFRYQFIHEKLINGSCPRWDICQFCVEEMELDEDDTDPGENTFDYCTCPPSDLDHEEWAAWYTEKLHYLDKLSALLHSTNKAWLSDLREGKMTVHFAFSGPNHIKFRILHQEQICSSTSDDQPVWDLFDKWGMFSLLEQHSMDITLAYEQLQEVERRGYTMTASVVREMRCAKASSSD
jgi:hypothetical protein